VYKAVFLGQPTRSSMHNLSYAYAQDQALFEDPFVVGLFIDNHDQNRAIDLALNDTQLVYNGLAYIWFLPGIPILYYGTEQGLEGSDDNYTDQWGTCSAKDGGDPCNREELWSSGYNRSNQFYKFIKNINLFRKFTRISKYPLIEINVSDTYYVYIRGPALVITTNIGNGTSNQTFDINVAEAENTTHLERQLSEGEIPPPSIQWLETEIVNLLDPNDTITVPSNGVITIQLLNGSPKIYYPRYAYNPIPPSSSYDNFVKWISSLF